MREIEDIEADLATARQQLEARHDSKHRTERVAELEAELAEAMEG